MKKLLAKIVYWFWLKKGARYKWSKIVRFFEKQFCSTSFPPCEVGEVEYNFNFLMYRIRYRLDKWYMLFDAISLPERIWERKEGDCDDFAVLAAEILKRNGIHVVGLLTVVGFPLAYSHTVCVFFRDGFRVVDLDKIVKNTFHSLEEVVEWLFKHLEFKQEICWDLVDINLNPIKFGWR